MPLLRADAERLSNNQLVSGVIEEIIKRDAIYALLPFVGTNHKAYVYNREGTIPTVNFADVNSAIGEGAPTNTQVTVTLKILAHNVDIDKFLAGTMNDTNNQIAEALAGAAKSVDQKFRDTFINGDVSSDALSFDGMKKLVTSQQTIDAAANGAALTFDMLDQLIDQVLTGRPDALLMRYGTYRALKALMRTSGGMVPEQLKIRNFDGNVPAYDGIPILLSEYLPSNEALGSSGNVTCSIYAARFNTSDGLHGIYGDPTAGVVVENLGTRESYDAWRYRLKWYVSMALKSTKSIARLRGITNT
jgi:hypothetical protein